MKNTTVETMMTGANQEPIFCCPPTQGSCLQMLSSQHSPVEHCVYELHGVPAHLSKHFPKEPQQYSPVLQWDCQLHDFPRQFSLHSPTAFRPRSQQVRNGEQWESVSHDFPTHFFAWNTKQLTIIIAQKYTLFCNDAIDLKFFNDSAKFHIYHSFINIVALI